MTPLSILLELQERLSALPADIDCKAAQGSKKVTLGQMMQSAEGGSVSQNLQKIHTQLFGK